MRARKRQNRVCSSIGDGSRTERNFDLRTLLTDNICIRYFLFRVVFKESPVSTFEPAESIGSAHLLFASAGLFSTFEIADSKRLRADWHYTEGGLRLNGRDELPLDAVVLCTGYDGTSKLADILPERERDYLAEHKDGLHLYR